MIRALSSPDVRSRTSCLAGPRHFTCDMSNPIHSPRPRHSLNPLHSLLTNSVAQARNWESCRPHLSLTPIQWVLSFCLNVTVNSSMSSTANRMYFPHFLPGWPIAPPHPPALEETSKSLPKNLLLTSTYFRTTIFFLLSLQLWDHRWCLLVQGATTFCSLSRLISVIPHAHNMPVFEKVLQYVFAWCISFFLDYPFPTHYLPNFYLCSRFSSNIDFSGKFSWLCCPPLHKTFML
jgi:hypothetical protein